jgi:major membrane immunogen (membrane-anchored lipoprotein)
MKKSTASIAIVLLMTLAFSSCGQSGGPKAGAAKSDDMLKLFPSDADGFFFVDMERVMEAEFLQKAITESEEIQAIIQKTNINPSEDIYFLGGAITQKEQEGDENEGAVVVNMKFDKDKLLSFIGEKVQEEGQEVSETDYQGFTLYKMWAEGKEACFSFIDESNIAVGNPGQVQSIIDVIKKKKDNVSKNKALSDLISKTDKQAILWGAILFKPETLEKVASESDMLEDLKGIQAASLSFDLKNNNYVGTIKLMGGDEEKNKEIANFLTQIKAFGALLAGEKPEIGEVLNSIEITSGPENVQILATIPEDVLSQLQDDLTTKEDKQQTEIK